jgi:predicted aspartyl protease
MFLHQSSNLPLDQQQRLHADFVANEQTYLKMRPALLAQYPHQWVAIHNGEVIAAGNNLIEVSDTAAASGGHPFIARVGAEDEVIFRIRRVEFAYDQTYQPFPLPRISITFWNHAETQSRTFADVIPDTGADSCLLPHGDCLAFDLFSSPYLTGVSGGVIGGKVPTLIYRGKAEINGKRLPAFIQPMPGGQERLIGRDVLNGHRVTFDGPVNRVVFEP